MSERNRQTRFTEKENTLKIHGCQGGSSLRGTPSVLLLGQHNLPETFRTMMFLRAFLAFLALPGIAAGIIPLVFFRFDPFKGDGNLFGLVMLGIGLSILLWCVRDFYVSGEGTLAPWDPPKNLVVVGLYRYVRNPMYISVILILLGWIIVTASPMVFGFTLILAVAFRFRVVISEEPWAEMTFGSDWLNYKNNVPRWLPRLRGYFPNQ